MLVPAYLLALLLALRGAFSVPINVSQQTGQDNSLAPSSTSTAIQSSTETTVPSTVYSFSAVNVEGDTKPAVAKVTNILSSETEELIDGRWRDTIKPECKYTKLGCQDD